MCSKVETTLSPLKQTYKLAIILLSIILRWSVSLYSYSGIF